MWIATGYVSVCMGTCMGRGGCMQSSSKRLSEVTVFARMRYRCFKCPPGEVMLKTHPPS